MSIVFKNFFKIRDFRYLTKFHDIFCQICTYTLFPSLTIKYSLSQHIFPLRFFVNTFFIYIGYNYLYNYYLYTRGIKHYEPNYNLRAKADSRVNSDRIGCFHDPALCSDHHHSRYTRAVPTRQRFTHSFPCTSRAVHRKPDSVLRIKRT